MGCLPDVDVMSFCSTRDRICKDGTHWLTDEWIEFCSQKLYDNNPHLSPAHQKRIIKHAATSRKHHSFWWHLRNMKF